MRADTPGGSIVNAVRAASKLRRQMAAEGIRGGITILGEKGNPNAKVCTFDFYGVSQSIIAQSVIDVLQSSGQCGCATLGGADDAVTCTCSD